jgi:hypothetical protein
LGAVAVIIVEVDLEIKGVVCVVAGELVAPTLTSNITGVRE